MGKKPSTSLPIGAFTIFKSSGFFFLAGGVVVLVEGKVVCSRDCGKEHSSILCGSALENSNTQGK